jgi:hypothetical protein
MKTLFNMEEKNSYTQDIIELMVQEHSFFFQTGSCHPNEI